MNEILQQMGSVDYSTAMSQFLSSIFSYGGSLLILILETIILFKVQVPLYGLRFVPIYGEYYFYQNLVPERRTFNVTHIILKCAIIVLTVVFVFCCAFMFISLFDSSSNGSGSLVGVILLGFLLLGCGIADFVVLLLVKMDISERFAFNRYLGILFAFIPLVMDICCLVNWNRYYNHEPMYTSDYDGYDGYSNDIE